MKAFRDCQRLIDDGVIGNQCNQISVAVGNVANEYRSPAVLHVLCNLPEKEYQTIKERQIWFVAPNAAVNGWNGPIPLKKSQLVYLASGIEKYGRKECILIAAHEIVHSLLGHTNMPASMELENETWRTVSQLGFGTQEQIRELRSRLGS